MYKLSICLLIKDENKYIEEWINHHIKLGVEHFYIYDNASKIPIKDTVLNIFESNLFTFIDWLDKYESMQIEAYNHCVQNFGNESEWIAFIDTDEFIQCDSVNVLDKYKSYDFVRINWVMFNANGQLKYSPSPVQERFTETFETAKLGVKFKSIVQPLRIKNMDVHYAIADSSTTANDIKLNHYYTRSLEEWEDKIIRGSCAPFCQRRYDEFFEFNPDLIEYKNDDFILEMQQYQKTLQLFDVKIMAHPSRKDSVLKILDQLSMDESVVSYDDRENGGDAIYVSEKAWRQPVSDKITHRIVLQDDVLLCNDFLKVASKIINDMPDVCISLYNGIPIDLRKDKTNPYTKVNELCGCGIILPIKYIDDCWNWINSQPELNYCRRDDEMIRRYCVEHGIEIYSTIPVTIQHLGDTEYKSLLNVEYPHIRISSLYRDDCSEILRYNPIFNMKNIAKKPNSFQAAVMQKRIQRLMKRR